MTNGPKRFGQHHEIFFKKIFARWIGATPLGRDYVGRPRWATTRVAPTGYFKITNFS